MTKNKNNQLDKKLKKFSKDNDLNIDLKKIILEIKKQINKTPND
jgi:hypothetical protein